MSKLQVVVLKDRFIYVGTVTRRAKTLKITNARNVRYWAKDGLGSVALKGPQAGDRIDACGDVVVQVESVQHTIDCNPVAWK